MNKKCTYKFKLTSVLELIQRSLVYKQLRYLFKGSRFFCFLLYFQLSSLFLISASSISPLLHFIYTALKHDGFICKLAKLLHLLFVSKFFIYVTNIFIVTCLALHCSTENMLMQCMNSSGWLYCTSLVKLKEHFWWCQSWGGLRGDCVPCKIWENSANLFSASLL